jgi:hypothetical protein
MQRQASEQNARVVQKQKELDFQTQRNTAVLQRQQELNKLLRENTAQHEQATAQLRATHAQSMQRQAGEQNARVVQKQQELDTQRQEQREEHEQTTEAMTPTSTAAPKANCSMYAFGDAGGCDFTIKTGDHVIYVNREALRSCSQYFQTEMTEHLAFFLTAARPAYIFLPTS